MKKMLGGIKIIVFVVLVLALFIGVTKHSANKTYNERLANEKITTLDTYSMNNYCKSNADAVMSALKAGDQAQLESLMIDSQGASSVMEFADWSRADFKNAISMGSGSLTVKPNKKGRMDVSERFFVNTDDNKYVFFIETVCSRLGRDNDGVSAVGVTTFSHFDATNYMWNGEKDDSSALAGKLFWK